MKLRSTTRPTFNPNKPLIFQITDWYSYDGNGEDDDEDDGDNENGESKSDNGSGDDDDDGDGDRANIYKKRYKNIWC